MSALSNKLAALREDHAAFIQGGVALDLATRDHRNIPRIARGLCCRVASDRDRLTIIVANRAIDRFIEALRGTQAIAAVFCLASTHRAIQIKGSDALIEPIRPTDQDLVEQAINAFGADIARMGYDQAYAYAYARAEMEYRPEELIGVAFTPDPVYEQTLGPKAGARL